jgi:formylglycine-generating enzyme required for sulfatase activity
VVGERTAHPPTLSVNLNSDRVRTSSLSVLIRLPIAIATRRTNGNLKTLVRHQQIDAGIRHWRREGVMNVNSSITVRRRLALSGHDTEDPPQSRRLPRQRRTHWLRRGSAAQPELTRDQLLAQLAAMQQRLETLNRQLHTRDERAQQYERTVSAGHDLLDNVIITGDGATYYGAIDTLNIRSAIFQAAPTTGCADPKELLWTYLNQVVLDNGALDLTGIDRKMAQDQENARLELAAVYTALDTLHTADMDRNKLNHHGHRDYMEMAERERQSALAFVNAAPYAALLGDPGSGKTTFASFLTLCLAGEILGLSHTNLSVLGEDWTLGALLPIRVVLRDFAAQLDPAVKQAQGDLLWEHITLQMGQSLADFVPLLRQHLLEEGALLILDGLDEVPEAQQRRDTVQQVVLDFRRQFPRVRILLTSRTYAYQRQAWRLPDFAEAVLAPFHAEQVDAFIDRWYSHIAQVRKGLNGEEALGRAAILKQAIHDNLHLHELAGRPLLLTLMASLHAWRGGSLPNDREQLYEESVELLLDIWERPKVVYNRQGEPVLQTESMAEWLRAPQPMLRNVLEGLAFGVHAGQREITGVADIDESDLVEALLRATDDPDIRPARVVEYVRDRAGLLANHGEGVYSFPHRTFQEYLAARHLTATNFPSLLVQLVREEPERWREVLLLAAAKVARGTPYAAWTLVGKLCPQPCTPERAAAARECDWWAALLAGQALVETNIHRTINPALDQDNMATMAAVRSWLQMLVSTGQLAAADRALAGRTLGVIGDQRSGVGVSDGLPAIDWVTVPPGPFLMGSNRSHDLGAADNEMPRFICTLMRWPYQISRYPITVAQYETFVQAGGYTERNFWTESGWTWRKEHGITGPNRYDGPFSLANHPQVGVSWYEAVAFCAWLSQQLNRPIRLPTEAEWERAARHADGRLYPWGNEFIDGACNLNDTNIGSTTAVGLFPAGIAVCGAEDMAGNVWEWCSTRWLPHYAGYEYKVSDDLAGSERRVLRGGAFYNSRHLLRCASRNFYAAPANRYSSIGFRIACGTR